MKGIWHHVRDVHQTSVLLGLLGAELHLVKGLLEELSVDAVRFDIFKRFEKCLLHFLEVVHLDALGAHCEGRLASGVIEAGSGTELGCDLALDYGAVEGCVGTLKEKR